MTIYPLVMAGGSGTRFWPLSRQARPKQFLPLASSRPLLLDTVLRVKGLATPRHTLVVCGPGHVKAVRRAAPMLPKENIVVEPVARNTAPAIALGALQVAHRDPRGIVAALASDHYVGDPKGFRRTLRDAAALAEEGRIVTLGIQPTRAETGYGYIELGGPLAGGKGFEAAAFREKPEAVTAERYLESGKHLWNAGIFVFRADVMLQALKRHLPQMASGLDALAEAIGTRRYARVLGQVFPKFPSISIDYAVAEKDENVAVIPGDFGWSDVGSFAALPEVRKADARGNVISGKGALVIDSDRCIVLAADRPLSVVGMRDVVVVDSGDAVLVVPREKAQDVRKVVELLKKRKLVQFL